jgi:transcriptional regulator with GAF, ATPase, and Fis domain
MAMAPHETARRTETHRRFLGDRVVRAVVLLSLALVLGLGTISAVDLAREVDRPHPGFLVFENGIVGPMVLYPPRMLGAATALRPQDRILAIDGRPVAGGRAIRAAAASVPVGTPLSYAVLRRGERLDLTIPTTVFSARDFAATALPFGLGALVLLAMGAVPVWLRPELAQTRILFAFALGTATAFGLLVFATTVSYPLAPAQHAAVALAKAAVVHLGLAFPKSRWPLTRHPVAVPAVLYGAMALQGALYTVVAPRWPDATTPFAYLAVATFLLGALLFTANLAEAAFRSSDPRLRQQARIVLPGPLVCWLTGALLIATTWGVGGAPPPASVYLLPLVVCFLAGGYAMVKTNLFEFDLVARRGIAVSAVIFAAVLAYVAVFALLETLFGVGPAWTSSAAALVLLASAPVALEPLRLRSERWVERHLFREHLVAAEAVRVAAADLARARDPAAVCGVVRDAVQRAFDPERVRLWAGPRDGAVRELDAPGGAVAPVGVAAALRRGAALDVDADEPIADAPRATLRELEVAGVRLLVPFPPAARSAGGIGVGARRDGRLYTSEDRELLEALASQVALALENARVFEELRGLERRLAQENVHLRAEIAQRRGFDEIIGGSSAIQGVLAQIEQVAGTEAGVLVTGETGSGKELVVRALHRLSARRTAALVKVACAAIPESLFESELFGHERGAFTGAVSRRIGRFELAHGGTLFLDDVDTLPLALQAKLLRAVQEGEVQRLGTTTVTKADVRVVAATNRDLLAEVRAGRFRQDLYYRLAVVPIRIPPLRERREDIPLLVQHLLDAESRRLGRPARPIREDALATLCAHAWPGNVRELRNTVQRAIVMSRGDAIELPLDWCEERRGAGPAEVPLQPLAEAVQRHKLERLRAALAAAGGNQSRAAQSLGLHRQSFARTLRSLGLEADGSDGAR